MAGSRPRIPIDLTGQELMGFLTLVAAVVAGGPQARFVSLDAPPADQLRSFMTKDARARLTLRAKSILHNMYSGVNDLVDHGLWTAMAYPVAGKTRHETPAQQLFCVLCYFGQMMLKTKYGHPYMDRYYELLRCTSEPSHRQIIAESELMDPLRAKLLE